MKTPCSMTKTNARNMILTIILLILVMPSHLVSTNVEHRRVMQAAPSALPDAFGSNDQVVKANEESR